MHSRNGSHCRVPAKPFLWAARERTEFCISRQSWRMTMSNAKSQLERNSIARLLERDVDRRRFLGGAAFLALSGLSLPAILEACGGRSATNTYLTLSP